MMELLSFYSLLPYLLILISSMTLSSASHSLPFPRLSARPPRRLARQSDNAGVESAVREKYTLYEYNQTLDHFSFRPESFTKFKQRYLVDTTYWGGAKANAPIFVYLGAEENIIDDISTAGMMQENAPQFKAMLVFIEHRFYGESIPYGWPVKRAINDKQVRGYLSTSQALADYAEVILYLKNLHSSDLSPVVVFGASYGGMLATWFRLKYPHVAMGALAASAAVLHHVTDHYSAYFDIASKDYRDTSENCYRVLKSGFEEMAKVGSQPNGQAKLSKIFNFCSGVNVETMIGTVLEQFKDGAQYDNPPDYPVEKACKAIDSAPKKASVLDKVYKGFAALSSSASTSNCTADPSKEDDDDSTLSYSWESCMELLHGEGVSSKDNIFPYSPLSLKDFKKDCEATYGVPSLAPSSLFQNYIGKNVKLDLRRFGSNIIFSNGKRDPWYLSGVTENISDTLVALTHPAAHCIDVFASAKTDPRWLTDLRKTEFAIIRGWVSKYYADLRFGTKAL